MKEPKIDVNVSLSRWPTRRLPLDETAVLVDQLAAVGVQQAWVSSLDGLLHKDIGAVNDRLVQECLTVKNIKMIPFGVVNPMLPGWQTELSRCCTQYKMRGIRLFPSYHGYNFASLEFRKTLALANEHRLLVSVAMQMEDERMMHPLMRVKPLTVAPLVDALSEVPGTRLLLLNVNRTMALDPATLLLLQQSNVFLDIAMLDGLGILEELLTIISFARLLYGSHAPLFYMAAAHLKIQESALEHVVRHAIQFANANTLLNPDY